jgi:hypothetical protein
MYILQIVMYNNIDEVISTMYDTNDDTRIALIVLVAALASVASLLTYSSYYYYYY